MADRPLIYSYEPGSGAFTNVTYADPSPLEPGVWLYAAHTTTERPPDYAEKQIPQWSGSAWQVIPDHRGETWFMPDGTPYFIDRIGDPAIAGLTSTQPVKIATQPNRAPNVID